MTSSLEVHILPVLKDNYTYIIRDSQSSDCVVVDPAVANPVIDFISEHHLNLKQIWITHFHKDHIGGLETLKNSYQCTVYAPAKEADKIAYVDETVSDLDMCEFCDHPFKVIELPGHTLGHVGYWLYKQKSFFCGDVLFGLGCGYLFEGTYSQMWDSLCKIRALPEDTLIYCGHEYTLDNAKFALSIDPNNSHLIEYNQEIEQKRAQNKPSVPLILKNEMYSNPFLRADLPFWEEKLKMQKAEDVEIFKALRKMKDSFKS